MATKNDEPLIMAANELAITNATAWDQFGQALQGYQNRAVDALLGAPTEALAMAQGRAQAIRDLFTLLANAKATAADIIAKRNAQGG